MAFEGNNLAFGNMNAELQEMITQGGLYENIDPLEATNAPADYPLGESFFANTSPNIASWQTALDVDATFTRLFVITRIDKNRLHALQDIIIASGTETKRFTRYNLNENWLNPRESGGGSGEWNETGVKVFSPNHAMIRLSNLNLWTNTTLPEVLRFQMNGVTVDDIPCRAVVRMWVQATATDNAGYGEVWFNTEKNIGQSYPITNYDSAQLMFSPSLRDFLLMSGGITYRAADGTFSYGVTKFDTPRTITVEIEVFTDNGKAEKLLSDVTQVVDNTTYTTPWTGTRERSLIDKAKYATLNALSGTTYVDSVNGNDQTGLPANQLKPFKTINAAIRSVERHLVGNIAIRILPGNYPEGIAIDGYFGRGNFTIYADTRDTVTLQNIVIQNCSCQVAVLRLSCNSLSSYGVQITNSNYVSFEDCNFSTPSKSIYSGIVVSTSNVIINSGTITNRTNAIQASTFGNVRAANVGGTGNTVGLYAESGGLIIKVGSTVPTGTTAESTVTGGQIR